MITRNNITGVSIWLNHALQVVCDQLGVRYRFQLNGLLSQAVKQHAAWRRCPTVKPKGELIQIVRQMLMTNRTLMRSQQPSFQETGYAVACRQQVFSDLGGATNHRVSIPPRHQSIVPVPSISFDFTPRSHHGFKRWDQRLPRGVGDMTHADPSDLVARLKLDRQQHQCLPLRSSAPFAGLFPTHIALVGLHNTVQTISSRTNHCPPQLMQPCPCCLVATQPQKSLNRQGACPVLLVGDMPHRAKPQRQRQSAALKDRSHRHRRLSPTSPAEPQPTGHPPCFRVATARTSEAVRPAQRLQVQPTSLLRRKLMLKLHQRPRICFHIRKHYPLGVVESNGYPSKIIALRFSRFTLNAARLTF